MYVSHQRDITRWKIQSSIYLWARPWISSPWLLWRLGCCLRRAIRSSHPWILTGPLVPQRPPSSDNSQVCSTSSSLLRLGSSLISEHTASPARYSAKPYQQNVSITSCEECSNKWWQWQQQALHGVYCYFQIMAIISQEGGWIGIRVNSLII